MNLLKKIIISYFILLILFTGLIIGVHTIPQSAIKENVVTSTHTLQEEGLYKKFLNFKLFQLDNFTDSYMLNKNIMVTLFLSQNKKYQLSLKVQNAQSEHNFLEVIKYKIQIAQICQEQNKSQDAYRLEEGIREAYAMLSDFEKVQAKSIIADYNSDMALYIDQDIDQDINRNK